MILDILASFIRWALASRRRISCPSWCLDTGSIIAVHEISDSFARRRPGIGSVGRMGRVQETIEVGDSIVQLEAPTSEQQVNAQISAVAWVRP